MQDSRTTVAINSITVFNVITSAKKKKIRLYFVTAASAYSFPPGTDANRSA